MSASDMLCNDCGGPIVSGQTKVSVNKNAERYPGVTVESTPTAGSFSKANIAVYHAQSRTAIDNSGRSCFNKAQGVRT